MRRYELADQQWDLLADLFPPEQGGGRPWRGHRSMVNAMLWILNAGSPWRDLPERYGPWQTAYNRFNRWRKDGTFDAILERLQMRLDEEGRIDWDLWMVDGSSVRAHASAAGGGEKGGLKNPQITHWVAREAGLAPRSTWLLTATERR
jgi:transposase